MRGGGLAVAIALGACASATGSSPGAAGLAQCLFFKSAAEKQADAEAAEDAKTDAEESDLRTRIAQAQAYSACNDPVSGRTYYVMRTTLETTWDKPAGGTLPPDTAKIVTRLQARLEEVLRQREARLAAREAARALAQAKAEAEADAAAARQAEHDRREAARKYKARRARLGLPEDASDTQCAEVELAAKLKAEKEAAMRAEAEADAAAARRAEHERRKALREHNSRRVRLNLPLDASDSRCAEVEHEMKMAAIKQAEEERARRAEEQRLANERRAEEEARRMEEKRREMERRAEEKARRMEEERRELERRRKAEAEQRAEFEKRLQASIASSLQAYSPSYQQKLKSYALDVYKTRPAQAMQMLAEDMPLAVRMQRERTHEHELARPFPPAALSPALGMLACGAGSTVDAPVAAVLGLGVSGVVALWVMWGKAKHALDARRHAAALLEETEVNNKQHQAIGAHRVRHHDDKWLRSFANPIDYNECRCGQALQATKDMANVWIQAMDSSGKTYYFNAKTQETSWTAP